MKKIFFCALLFFFLINLTSCKKSLNTKIYYPDAKQEKLLIQQININKNIKTQDKQKKILDALKKNKVINDDAEINNLNLEGDPENQILTIDFKNNFIDTNNLGAETEDLILKAIIKTFGEVYNAKKIKIMIDGKNYESGHIKLDDGDYFDVE